MYNETYDEYIRNILGYPQNNFYNDEDYYNFNTNYRNDIDLEQAYPEIYKIVYPMILKRCNNLTRNITNNEIDNMTDEIYYALEEKNEIQVNSNFTNEVRTAKTNISKIQEKKSETKIKETIGDHRETRQFNNGERDLIKILLIRELLNKPARPPMEPPVPGPRPPMRPPMAPPFRPGRRPF